MPTIGSSNNIYDNQLQRQMPIAEQSNNAFDKPPLYGSAPVPTANLKTSLSLPKSPQEKRERPVPTIGSSNNFYDNQLQRQMPIAEHSNNAFDKSPSHGSAVATNLNMSRPDGKIVFSTSATSLNGMLSVTASNNTSTDHSDDSMNLSRQDKTNEYMSTIAGMSSEYMLSSSDSSKGGSGPDSNSSVLQGGMFGSKDSSSGSKVSSSDISGGSSSVSGGSAGGSGGSTAGSGSAGSSSGSTGTNDMPSFPL